MKKISYLIFIILLYSSSAFSQWIMRSPYPADKDINDICVVSPSKIIMCTNYVDVGDMVISNDGGLTWSSQNFLPETGFKKMSFVNSQTGYAITAYKTEKTMKTTNGGVNWFFLPNAIDSINNGMDFIDALTGWTVGDKGFISKTTNGGASWFSQTNASVTTKKIRSVDAINSSTLFAVGEQNLILKSTDGGTTFSVLPTVFRLLSPFRYIQFINSTTGIIVGDQQRIARTTNGGVTWDSVYGSGTDFNNYFDFNPSKSVGICVATNHQVSRTTNLGQTWAHIPIDMPYSNDMYSIKFVNDSIAYIGMANGKILKTTDAGLTWFESSRRIYNGTLKGVFFVNNYTGFICGTSGFVGKTTDGGLTSFSQNSGVTQDLNKVKAVNENIAYACGSGGTMIKTTDGGNNWITQITSTTRQLFDLDFVNENTGYAVGSNGAGSNEVTIRTTNGGSNWVSRTQIEAVSDPKEIDFIDSLTGWAAVTQKIFKTTDGAVTWVQQYAVTTGGFYALKFINELTGFAGGGDAAGGKFYKTTNAGMNWVIINNTVSGNAMDFGNESNGVIVGSQGYIVQTTDGGYTWVRIKRQTLITMNAVHYNSDGNNAWIVGDQGLLMQHNNTVTIISHGNDIIPEKYYLYQNYPNPFNPVTSLKFEIASNSFVQLKIYDALGREVAELVNEEMQAGVYERTFDASKLSSGIYYYQLSSNDFLETKKMLLIK